MKRFLAFYREVNRTMRQPFVNLRWRLLMFAFWALFVYAAWLYIEAKYSTVQATPANLFYWFIVGTASGMAIFILTFEGEIILALYKQARAFQRQFEHKGRRK